MQMNRACVVSDFATRGFSTVFQDGVDYCVAHTDGEYVDKLQLLLTDEICNKTISSNACKKVKEHYSYTLFSSAVKHVFEN